MIRRKSLSYMIAAPIITGRRLRLAGAHRGLGFESSETGLSYRHICFFCLHYLVFRLQIRRKEMQKGQIGYGIALRRFCGLRVNVLQSSVTVLSGLGLQLLIEPRLIAGRLAWGRAIRFSSGAPIAATAFRLPTVLAACKFMSNTASLEQPASFSDKLSLI
jgi:hypothetical protein